MSSRTRSDFGSLGERVTPSPDPPVQFVEPRHVWIDGTHAGLLIAWRQLADWQGRVFWCPPDTPEAAIDWIPRERLQPRT